MADTEAQELLKKKTVPLLRAVLTSKAKEGVPLHMLLHEFQEQTYSALEFQKMGYGTLEQYLRDSPDVCRVQRAPEGYLSVKGVSGGLKVQKTASHFTGGKKPNFKTSGFMQNNNMMRSPLLATPSYGIGYKKFAASSPISVETGATRGNGELAPQFQKTSTGSGVGGGKNLFMNNQTTEKPASFASGNKDSKELQMTIFPGGNERTKKTTHFSSTSNSYDAPSGVATTKTQLTPDALKTIGKRLRELLVGKPNGLWAPRLQPEYKAKYNDILPEDFRDIIREHFLSFIKIDIPLANMEILYYKDEKSAVPSPVGDQSQRKVEIVKQALPTSHVNNSNSNTSQQMNHTNGTSRQNVHSSTLSKP